MTIKKYQMLVDGEWVDASDGGVCDSCAPSTGLVWATWPEATAADVDKAVRAAAAAFAGLGGGATGLAKNLQVD